MVQYQRNALLVDLVSTGLELYGIEHELVMDGQNLFDDQKERFIFSEGTAYGYEKKAVLDNNWKLIHSEGDKVSLLFDLAQDPKEKHDLATVKPQELQKLKATLPQTEAKGTVLEIDEEIKRKLRYLGYI